MDLQTMIGELENDVAQQDDGWLENEGNPIAFYWMAEDLPWFERFEQRKLLTQTCQVISDTAVVYETDQHPLLVWLRPQLTELAKRVDKGAMMEWRSGWKNYCNAMTSIPFGGLYVAPKKDVFLRLLEEYGFA